MEENKWVRIETYPADEAVRMPLAIQSRDVVFHDGPIASTAFWCKHIEVIVSAIGLSVPLMEAFLPELFTTLGAEKVLRVPGLLESRHAFL